MLCCAVAVRLAWHAHFVRAAYLAGQVEQKRCNIPRDVPCAVQQWQGLIAVNYAGTYV